MKRLLLSTVVISLLSGCVSNQPKPIVLTKSFDRSEVAFIHEEGTNTIEGQALLRTNGGNAVTCAGMTVRIVPVTFYSSERIFYFYRDRFKGFMPASRQGTVKFQNDSLDYYDYRRDATCNAQGSFVFKNIPDGTYYLTAPVVWKIGANLQGGTLMERVKVSGGEVKELIMTL